MPDGNYNNLISRESAAALIPDQVSREIIKQLPEVSAALSLFRQVRMSTAQMRMPVMAALPVAYFVNGDTGLKQTTEAGWESKYLHVEEIATILPVPEAVLEDTDYDIWGEVRPFMAAAVGEALDAAVFFGINKPDTWPDAIVPSAEAAGNVETQGTADAEEGGIAGDLSNLFAQVEGEGYDVNGIVAATAWKGAIRQFSVQGAEGADALSVSAPTASVFGVRMNYLMSNLWKGQDVNLVLGDFREGILGIRRDLTWKILDQAVINDADGKIIYNLPQQDMVAMRVVFRVAWTVAETGEGYPFGVMKAA